MADVAGIKTYRRFSLKRFKYRGQTKHKDTLREKKCKLQAKGWLVRVHVEQMLTHKNYQIYVRRP